MFRVLVEVVVDLLCVDLCLCIFRYYFTIISGWNVDGLPGFVLKVGAVVVVLSALYAAILSNIGCLKCLIKPCTGHAAASPRAQMV